MKENRPVVENDNAMNNPQDLLNSLNSTDLPFDILQFTIGASITFLHNLKRRTLCNAVRHYAKGGH